MLQINIVYLGTKGAGSKLILDLKKHFANKKEINPRYIVSQRLDKADLLKNENTIQLPKNRLIQLLMSWRLLYSQKYYSSKINIHNEKALFLMMSPMDSLLMRAIKKQSNEIYMIAHDLKQHPGDYWPTQKAITKRLRIADKIIFLSNSVSNEFADENVSKSVVLSNFQLGFDLNEKKIPIIFGSYILFIGRIRKYKGIEILIESWKDFQNQDLVNDFKLVIAGQGSLKKVKTNNNIILINKWLSDDEIVNLISNCEVVVFPYIEVSQSGLLPIALTLNKKILISNLDGLLEQCSGYPNFRSFESGNPVSLQTELFRLLKSELRKSQEKGPVKEWLDDLISFISTNSK